MPDYKFRLTVDLELTTDVPPSTMREFLKMETEDWLAAKAETYREVAAIGLVPDDGNRITSIASFDVRTKRLDDTALIGSPISIRVTLKCACGHTDRDVLVERLPVTCRRCRRTIRIEGTVKP